MRNIASICTDFLIKKEIINVAEREIYEYGFDITLYTLLSTCGLLLIGALLKQLVNTVVWISVFYLCQSTGGGYHASTHLRCFLGMSIGMCATVMILSLPIPREFFYWLGNASVLVLVCFPLVLHPNKSYLEKKKKLLVRKSIVSLCLSIVASLIIVGLTRVEKESFSVGYTLAALSRLSAIIQNRRDRVRNI